MYTLYLTLAGEIYGIVIPEPVYILPLWLLGEISCYIRSCYHEVCHFQAANSSAVVYPFCRIIAMKLPNKRNYGKCTVSLTGCEYYFSWLNVSEFQNDNYNQSFLLAFTNTLGLKQNDWAFADDSLHRD